MTIDVTGDGNNFILDKILDYCEEELGLKYPPIFIYPRYVDNGVVFEVHICSKHVLSFLDRDFYGSEEEFISEIYKTYIEILSSELRTSSRLRTKKLVINNKEDESVLYTPSNKTNAENEVSKTDYYKSTLNIFNNNYGKSI